MPHEGYADPVMNDEPRFHSDMPISELTEARHSSHRGKWRQLNPLVAKTADGVTQEIM